MLAARGPATMLESRIIRATLGVRNGGLGQSHLDRARQRGYRGVAGRRRLRRRWAQHTGPYRGIARIKNSKPRAIGPGKYRSAETSASRGRAASFLWQRRDAFARKRHHHWTLGNGRRVAGPSVSGLQEGLSPGLDR